MSSAPGPERPRRPGGGRPSARRPAPAGGRAPTRPAGAGPSRSTPAPDTRPPAVEASGERPLTLRLSALASGVEAVGALLYAALLAINFLRTDQEISAVSALGLVAVFAVLGAGLAVCAVGLWRARRRPRALAAVVHALLVFLSFSIGGASLAFGLAFFVVGGGGLASLFAKPTSRALGRGRLPGS